MKKRKIKLKLTEWPNFQALMQFSFSIKKVGKGHVTVVADSEKLKTIGY